MSAFIFTALIYFSKHSFNNETRTTMISAVATKVAKSQPHGSIYYVCAHICLLLYLFMNRWYFKPKEKNVFFSLSIIKQLALLWKLSWFLPGQKFLGQETYRTKASATVTFLLQAFTRATQSTFINKYTGSSVKLSWVQVQLSQCCWNVANKGKLPIFWRNPPEVTNSFKWISSKNHWN